VGAGVGVVIGLFTEGVGAGDLEPRLVLGEVVGEDTGGREVDVLIPDPRGAIEGEEVDGEEVPT